MFLLGKQAPHTKRHDMINLYHRQKKMDPNNGSVDENWGISKDAIRVIVSETSHQNCQHYD